MKLRFIKENLWVLFISAIFAVMYSTIEYFVLSEDLSLIYTRLILVAALVVTLVAFGVVNIFLGLAALATGIFLEDACYRYISGGGFFRGRAIAGSG